MADDEDLLAELRLAGNLAREPRWNAPSSPSVDQLLAMLTVNGAAAAQFTPSTNPILIPFDAGTTTSGDSQISFPASVTVPANGTTTLTVSVNPGLPSGAVVQGWITLTRPSGPYHFAYYAVVP